MVQYKSFMWAVISYNCIETRGLTLSCATWMSETMQILLASITHEKGNVVQLTSKTWVFYQSNITPICVNLGDTIPANFVLLQRKVTTSRTLKFICKEDHSTYFRCEIFQGFCTNSGFFQGCYLVHCLFLFNLSQLLLSSLYFPCLSFLFKALLFSFKVFLALNLEQLFLTPFLLQW